MASLPSTFWLDSPGTLNFMMLTNSEHSLTMLLLQVVISTSNADPPTLVGNLPFISKSIREEEKSFIRE